MKILIFNWRDLKNPAAGGAEVYVHEIAKRWANSGHEVSFFAPRFKGSKKEEMVDGIRIIRDGGRYSVYWKAYRFYKKSNEKYDVVVDGINTIPFFTSFYVKEKKAVIIYQMTGDVYFKLLPKPLAYIPYYLEPILFRIYKKTSTIVLSESIKEELVNIGFPPENITVVSPGIDHETFETGKKTEYPSVLYLNRVVGYKNPDHLIKAFKSVKENVPDARLIIAGCRGGKYVSYLNKLVEELNLKDVEFYPFLNGEKKKEMLRTSWVHVLPSTKEGWGISVIEAGASGTPTVAYDVAGLRNSVKNNVTGILVPYKDIEGLAKGIKNILTDNEFRHRLSENSVKYSNEFSWSNSSEKFINAIKGVIK